LASEKVMLSPISLVLFVALLALAAWSDVRTRRIPNVLTVSGFAIALALHSFVGGAAVWSGLMGASIALVIGLLLLATGGMGGGDAKLLIMVGAFLGPQGFLMALLLTTLAGGALALAWSHRFGMLTETIRHSGSLALHWATLGRSGSRRTLATPGVLDIPFGVAIAAGALATLLLL
jgi:prepilin peptidase CpaA